jgi:hypothetical protein
MRLPGDIALDLLQAEMGVPPSEIDVSAWTAINTSRPYDLALQIAEPTEALAILRTIEQSIIAFSAVDRQGRITVVPYTSSGTPLALAQDEALIEKLQWTPTFRDLTLEYNLRPRGRPDTVTKALKAASYTDKAEASFPVIRTYLKSSTHANTIAALYASLLGSPRLEVLARSHAGQWERALGGHVRYGHAVWGLPDTAFFVKDTAFWPARGETEILLAERRTLHADETAHSDAAHADATPHSDTAHSDFSDHGDVLHSNFSNHSDALHSNFSNHSDVLHSNFTNHSDTAHSNFSNHGDHSDEILP